jgi:predicted Fe-S protein YdhL (DUF1289 family)
MFLCELCGSPCIQYTQTVEFAGFTLSGKEITETMYDGYAYCWACERTTEAMEGYLLYNDGELYSIMEDYDRHLRIYMVPFRMTHDELYPEEQPPELLATLQLNEFTRALLNALLDDYAPHGYRLEMFYTLLGEVVDYAQ